MFVFILPKSRIKPTNIEIIKYCQEQFDFHLPSVLIARRRTKFLSQIAGFISLNTVMLYEKRTSCVLPIRYS